MEKLSNTEAELKKSVAYKKSAKSYLIITLRDISTIAIVQCQIS